MNKLILLPIVVILLGLGSCKKKSQDPDYCSTNWYTEIQDELTAVSNAGMAYGNNPTTATCTSYKAALTKYIDALEPWGECTNLTAAQKADFDDSIDEARADLANACD